MLLSLELKRPVTVRPLPLFSPRPVAVNWRVSPMLSDDSDLIIVRSTINLGHDLGLKVVAEGVEDEATFHRLAGLGCDFAQGYHFSKPLAPAAFSEWIGVPAQASAPVVATPARLSEHPAAA